MERICERETELEPFRGVLGQQRTRALEEVDSCGSVSSGHGTTPRGREQTAAAGGKTRSRVIHAVHFRPVPERLLEVVAEHLLDLRLPSAHRRRKPVCELLVELGPHLLRQGVVRRVADEHVAEAVCVVTVAPLLTDQLLADERLKSIGVRASASSPSIASTALRWNTVPSTAPRSITWRSSAES